MVKYVKASGSRKIEYRNDQFGTGETNLYDIVEFEMEELENIDIPAYLAEQYCYAGSEEDSEEVIEFLKGRFPGYKYALWLCSKEAVKDLYSDFDLGDDFEITAYEIPDDAVIISDLGYDGRLYITKTRMYPMEED